MWLQKYCKTHRKRASDDSAKFLKEHILWEILLIFIAAIGGWFVQKPLDQIASASLFGLLAVALIIVGTYFFNLFASPIRIFRDHEQEIASLKEAIQSRIDIIFTPNQEPFEHTEPANSGGLSKRYFRIAIQNQSKQSLTNCKLQYHEMNGNGLLPRSVRLWNDDPPSKQEIVKIRGIDFDRWISPEYKQAISLNSGERAHYNFAFLDETDPKSEIQLFYATTLGEQVPSKVPKGQYVIKVRAYAEIGDFAEADFRLWVDDGMLRLQQIKL